jgi:hypothetical protein
MKPLYIFDLDGTLALIEHRRHFVERPRAEVDWNAFFAACLDDAPNHPVIGTMERLLESGAEVWIFSGRSDAVRRETMEWLNHWASFTMEDLSGPMLRMREAGDFTPDHELKRQWYESMLQIDKDRLVAVFDDRTRVVAEWRELGVPCFQVADGRF